MLKVILKNNKLISPFNEPARDLRVQNKPLWLWQRDILAPYSDKEIEINSLSELATHDQPTIVCGDHLFFDAELFREFITQAQKLNHPSQLSFSSTDKTFTEHVLPLSNSFEQVGEVYLSPLWFFPAKTSLPAIPFVLDMLPTEVGYYNVPAYMAGKMGDLVYHLPGRAFIAIDSWVHLFIADIIFSLFSRGIRFEQRLKQDLFYKLNLFSKAILEGRQLLQTSELVHIGKNCVIDPTAILHGPTTIGDNVTIGAGVVIENSIIGNNANLSQGVQVMLSVVGDGTFLPFNAAVFMTTLMEKSIISQNACLQMCVIGRNTFIGAGTTFTDFNLIPIPIRAMNGQNVLSNSNRPVLGSAVGHNCRIGAGLVIYPGRMIESDVVLIGSDERHVVRKNVSSKESDHLKTKYPESHTSQYSGDIQDNLGKW